LQFSDIRGFVAEGPAGTGETLPLTWCVGEVQKGQEYLVAKLFGDDVRLASAHMGFAVNRSYATCSREPHSRACGFMPGFRAVPHLLEVSRAADQGLRGRAATPAGNIIQPVWLQEAVHAKAPRLRPHGVIPAYTRQRDASVKAGMNPKAGRTMAEFDCATMDPVENGRVGLSLSGERTPAVGKNPMGKFQRDASQ